MKNYYFFNFIFHFFERERAQAGAGTEGETDSPLSREPVVGLDPQILGS